MDTKTADKITSGLGTKSDKIRALDKAGYERADIARYLGIRYQHVRNVLVKGGTANKPPKKISEKPAIPVLRVDTLLKAGFLDAGRWVLKDDKIVLTDKHPAKCAVYAFAENGVVLYVGIASRSLMQRFKSYIRPGATQRTSIRINALIADKLRSKSDIHVLMAHPENSDWNGLPVNLAAGLEVGLIDRFKPIWNKRGI